MPTPIPAPNIMENHEKLENSGFSPTCPKLSLPAVGQMASPRHTMMKNATVQMYQAAKFARITVFYAPKTSPAHSGQTIAQTTRHEIMILLITVTLTLNPP